MSERLKKIFESKSPKKKLVAYFVGCYPDYKASLETIKQAVDNGVSIIEVGYCTSEASAEGPIIKEAHDHVLANGGSLKETIKLGRLFINSNRNNKSGKGRLIAIFQPHRYSRVLQFTKEFALELSKADVIYVTSIFGAGEVNENQINSRIITDLIYKKNKNVRYINNYYEITKNFFSLTQKGDLIINMGAGNCHNFWSILNEKNN